jgi:hypothetical protein
MTPVLLFWLFLELGTHFLPGQPGTVILPISASCVVGMTGVSLCTKPFFVVEMGSQELFCLDWPQTMIFPISASQVARITRVSHGAWL